jgi:two-component system, LytTR family, sensor kinase
MMNPKNLKSNLLKFSLLVVLCLLLGLIDGFRSFVSAAHKGEFYLELGLALSWDLWGWLSWVFLTPLTLWLCQKFPLEAKNWKKGFIVFFPVGFLFAFIRIAFPFIIEGLFFGGFENIAQWLPKKYFFLLTDYIIAFIFFGFVLAFGQAINYYQRFREEELRASQLELLLSRAQLQALKMQLHPHFLFNTLNSISALQMEDVQLAQKMTARLGDFLRMTLQNIGVQEVTFEQEIEFLQCYLEIEKVRFGQRLTTDIKVETQALDCQVPNLILQPLVENAIKHGIAPNKKDGQINIRGIKDNGWLRVEIEDNGNGIEENKMENVFAKGLGLANTKARLQQFYGSNFRFELENLQNGLRIILCLPNKTSEKFLN